MIPESYLEFGSFRPRGLRMQRGGEVVSGVIGRIGNGIGIDGFGNREAFGPNRIFDRIAGEFDRVGITGIETTELPLMKDYLFPVGTPSRVIGKDVIADGPRNPKFSTIRFSTSLPPKTERE